MIEKNRHRPSRNQLLDNLKFFTRMPLIEYPGPHTVASLCLETAPTSSAPHGTLASLFYPTNTSSTTTFPRSPWLPGPRGWYAKGYGDFVRAPRWFSGGPMQWVMGAFTMPAVRGGEVGMTGLLPVVVLSHGLGGCQTTYSTLCGSLASRGFVVLSLEHRDRSAAASARSNYTERIDYQHPSTKESEALAMRKSQLEQRVQEVYDAFDLLRRLNEGGEVPNLLGNPLPDFKTRLDLDSATLVGHSFGGATALKVLQQPNHPYAAAVILDPWMFALPAREPITTPLLSIQCEQFHWPANLTAFREIWNAPVSSAMNRFGVVRGTKHQDISDVPSLVSGALKVFTGGEGNVSARVVHATYDSVVSRFLKDVLGGRNTMAAGVEVQDVDTAVYVQGDGAFEVLDRFMEGKKK
ncbi:platelet-activating factor acetylhydrolase [Chytriomyces sp. MP71]|nr:platelet-activating factor acetylhydrolase [Chytriomyces sp. MP71]